MDIGFAIGSIMRLQVPRVRMENGWALGKFAGEFAQTFAAFIERAGHEYAKLSATPKDYAAFVAQISKMWETEPNWTDAQPQSIRAPVLVADGDHDEAIKRAHTEYIAATIPGAGLLILPNTSHFAFLQDPILFDAALLHFLGDR